MKSLFTALTALGVLALSATAWADYSTDFESPFATGDLSVAPWSTVAAGANPAGSIVSSTIDTANNNTKVLHIPGTASATWVDTGAGVETGTLAFDLLMSGVAPHPTFTLIAGVSDVSGGHAVRWAISNVAGGADMDLRIYDPGLGTTAVVLTDFMAKDSWTNIKIDFNSVTDTYALAVNDVPQFTGQPYWGSISEIHRVYWGTSAYTDQIDNFSLLSPSLEIPEPASLLLLGVSGLMVASRRKRATA